MRWKVSIIVIISYLMLSFIALFVILLPEPQGYLLPFYDQFPVTLWMAFISVGILSMLLVVNGVLRNSKSWIHGSIILLMTYLIYYSLPRSVGLRFWASPRSDEHAHLSHIEHVISTGELSESAYPTLHVYMSEIFIVTGSNPGSLSLYSWFHTMMFILGIFLFVRCVSGNRELTILVLLAALPLVYGGRHFYWLPWFLSFSLIPLSMFFFEKSRRMGSNIPLIGVGVLLIAFSTYHPMTSGIFVAILVIHLLSFSLHDKRNSDQLFLPGNNLFNIFIISYTMWMLSRENIQSHLINIVSGIVLHNESGMGEDADRAAESGYTIQQLLVDFVVFEWGHIIIYVCVGGVGSIYITYKAIIQKEFTKYIFVPIMYSVGLMIAVTGLVFDIVANEPIRINQVTVFASIFSVGILLFLLSHKSTTNRNVFGKVVIGVLVTLIITSSIIGAMQFYNQKNHLVESDYKGSEFALEYQDYSVTTISSFKTHEVTMYLIGFERADAIHWSNRPFDGRDNDPPDRLGYDESDRIGDSFDEEIYLHTTGRDLSWWKLEPENRYEHIDFYTENNVNKLNNDPTANKLYHNGNYAVWNVV